MSDESAAKELRRLMSLVKSVRRLILVTKSSEVVDIC